MIYSYFEIGLKPAVVSCLTNALARPPIALERVVQGLKRIGQSSCLHSKKIFGWRLQIFCTWRHNWSSFGAILAHVAWPRAQPLGQSISLKFLLETRLESESFEPLIDFLAFPVQKLW